MPHLILLLSSLIGAMLLLSACAAPGAPPVNPIGTPAPKKLTVQDNGRSQTLSAGELLDITLDANPTTGYQWEVAAVDAQVLKLLGEPEYATSGTMPGSGGQTTFHFQAAGAGQTPLQLIYHRSFEKDQPPADTFEVDVVVK